jgi:SAM-dependent methyltransferase
MATMDETADWQATQRLRAWERSQLGLRSGQRLLDVGCGLGDAALGLAGDLGAGVEVVGVDASAAMIAGARARAHGTKYRVRFAVGDALALDEPAGSFDAVRSERCLQWVTDPEAAVAEMARVVPANIGGRLADVVRAAGLRPVAHTMATQTWDAWDPDESPAPHGCFSMSSLADDLVETGHLPAGGRERLVATIHAAARADRFSMALTMFGLVAVAPTTSA